MNINNFRVSVVITSFNQKLYLTEAIESIINQTVKPHEIIIADDASTDGSVELIKGYLARYPGWIKGVFQEKNVAISRNRNAALYQVTGNYVAIFDGVDRYLPRNIELQIKALIEHPEAGCVYTNWYFTDAQGMRTRIRDVTVRPSGDLLTYIATCQRGLLRSMIISYDLIKKIGFFDERFPKHDGFILSLRLAKLTEFAYVFAPIAEKRQHDKGDSKSFSARERLHYIEDVHKEALSFTGDLPPQEIRRIRNAWSWELIRHKLLIAVEENKRIKILLYILCLFTQHPRSIQRIRRLIKAVLQ